MKARVIKDRRSDADRMYDDMFNKMVRDANLNARQRVVVQNYLRSIIRIKLVETEAVMEMAYLLALIESEKFGTNPRNSTRLKRVQNAAAAQLNDVYERGCINANGFVEDYDGCAVERLQSRLANYGIEYSTKIGGGEDD